jgi:2-C-methyl-D-erythritol 4-phosphate cytidylyltransferase
MSIELSHRPSNREKYSIIIPAAGLGRRMKTYGPKSLTPIGNETILSKQLKIIYVDYQEIKFYLKI